MPNTDDTVTVPRAVLVDLARLLERLVVSSARIGSWDVSADEANREFGRWATDSDLAREAAARRREVFTLLGYDDNPPKGVDVEPLDAQHDQELGHITFWTAPAR